LDDIKNIVEEDQIDLREVVKIIWGGRKLIAMITSIFLVLGVVIALTSRVEYQAYCRLLPELNESSNKGLGGFGGLAGLAGIDLNGLSGSGSLSPDLYPQIVNSLPSQIKIVNDTLYFEKENLRTSSWEYFKSHESAGLIGGIAKYTIGLPALIRSWMSDKDKSDVQNNSEFYRFTKEEWKFLTKFKERVNVYVDSKSGLIDIVVEMPDPMAAAQLTDIVLELMTNKVTEYKTEKIRIDLEFVQKAYDDAKAKFSQVQKQLAIVTDRNQNINSAAARIQIESIQNEYNLAFEIFKNLASRLEQSKIKLKENTPVFTVLEPVRVPEDKSKPKRFLIVFIFGFLGVAIAGAYVFLKNFLFGKSKA